MFKNVLVPVDGSETAERAIEKAVEIAKACGAKLHFLYVANINQLAINACLSDAILSAVTKAGDVILERAMEKCPRESKRKLLRRQALQRWSSWIIWKIIPWIW